MIADGNQFVGFERLEAAFGVCLQRDKRDMEYRPYELAMLLVEENQPWLPTLPTTDLAKLLRQSVRANLNRSGVMRVNDNQVMVFTAVGTPLDIWHGVDGYVVVKMEDPHVHPREFMITFDLTTNPDKVEESLKADLILMPDHFENKPVIGCRAGLLVTRQLLELRRLPLLWRPVFGFGGRIGKRSIPRRIKHT